MRSCSRWILRDRVDFTWSQAEAHIQQAADALLASDTAQLEHSSSLLREAAALLSRALSGPAACAALSAQELARVRSVNERLGVARAARAGAGAGRSAAGQCGATRACTHLRRGPPPHSTHLPGGGLSLPLFGF